jgi:prepilin-type processing-associated H-X9-DG protein
VPPAPETRPAETTLLYEAEQDFAEAPILPTYRHSGGTQILYFDGHAKWIKGSGPKDNDD